MAHILKAQPNPSPFPVGLYTLHAIHTPCFKKHFTFLITTSANEDCLLLTTILLWTDPQETL